MQDQHAPPVPPATWKIKYKYPEDEMDNSQLDDRKFRIEYQNGTGYTYDYVVANSFRFVFDKTVIFLDCNNQVIAGYSGVFFVTETEM